MLAGAQPMNHKVEMLANLSMADRSRWCPVAVSCAG